MSATPALIGVRVTARLSSAPVLTHPVMLDSLTLYGIGAIAAATQPARFDRPVCPELYDWPQPYAVLALGKGDDAPWWSACSQVTPTGAQSVTHQHRRPPMAQYEQHGVRSVNIASGADKLRRRALPQRIDQRVMEWTAVLDEARCEDLRRRLGLGAVKPQLLLGLLLNRCHGVGQGVRSGFGSVVGWEVNTDEAVNVAAFGTNLELRHLPQEVATAGAMRFASVPGMRASQLVREVPLRAPYHTGKPVMCFQLTELRARGAL